LLCRLIVERLNPQRRLRPARRRQARMRHP
jgi:hypothetical protein